MVFGLTGGCMENKCHGDSCSDIIHVTLTRVIDGHEYEMWSDDLVLSVGEGDELIEENLGYCPPAGS